MSLLDTFFRALGYRLGMGASRCYKGRAFCNNNPWWEKKTFRSSAVSEFAYFIQRCRRDRFVDKEYCLQRKLGIVSISIPVCSLISSKMDDLKSPNTIRHLNPPHCTTWRIHHGIAEALAMQIYSEIYSRMYYFPPIAIVIKYTACSVGNRNGIIQTVQSKGFLWLPCVLRCDSPNAKHRRTPFLISSLDWSVKRMCKIFEWPSCAAFYCSRLALIWRSIE